MGVSHRRWDHPRAIQRAQNMALDHNSTRRPMIKAMELKQVVRTTTGTTIQATTI